MYCEAKIGKTVVVLSVVLVFLIQKQYLGTWNSLKLVLVPNEITDKNCFAMLVRNIIFNAYKYTKTKRVSGLEDSSNGNEIIH